MKTFNDLVFNTHPNHMGGVQDTGTDTGGWKNIPAVFNGSHKQQSAYT